MSIFIIRGPEASGALIRTAMPLPAPVLKSLVHRAIDAGTSVAIRACGSEQELLDALRVADHSRGEVTLLDPGACANSLRLQRLLPYLHNAYVEVHDDGAVAEPCLPAGTSRWITWGWPSRRTGCMWGRNAVCSVEPCSTGFSSKGSRAWLDSTRAGIAAERGLGSIEERRAWLDATERKTAGLPPPFSLSYFSPRNFSSGSTDGSLPRKSRYRVDSSTLLPRERILSRNSWPLAAVRPPCSVNHW